MKSPHVALLLLALVPSLLAAQPRDSVVFTPTGDCCFTVTVLNRNPNKLPIDDFHIVVLSAGTTIAAAPGPSAPADWTVAAVAPDTVSFQGSPGAAHGMIRAGDDYGPFTVCFHNASPIISIRWITTFGGQPVTAVTTELQCAYTCDNAVPAATDNCCYNWTVFNLNSQQLDVDDFHVAISTPGVVFTSNAPPAGWTATAPNPSTLTFALGPTGAPIQPGHSLDGFITCVSAPPTGGNQVIVRWRTTKGGKTICEGVDTLVCDPPPQRCDTVEVTPSATGDCCYDLTLRNLHTPAGPLNDFHLTVLTPGASFAAGSASGPWTVSSQTPTAIGWQLTGAVLASGNSQPGFHFCLQPGAAPAPVTLRWESTLNGQTVCSDSFTVTCQPSQQRCDTIRVDPQQGCCFNFGIINLHTPAGPINDFHVEVKTPGVVIVPSPQYPAGWTLGSLSSDKAEFQTANAPVLPGAALPGFVVCFDSIPPSGSFLVQWKTTLDGKTVCEDSLWLRCEPPASRCDSVEVLPAGDCCSELVLWNLHTPAGPLNDFHLTVLTPGASFAPGSVFGPWAIGSQTSTTVAWQLAGAVLQSGAAAAGFHFCVQAGATSPAVTLRWESTLNGQVVCSDTFTVFCKPAASRCDTVRVKALDRCCFDFSVVNQHLPAGAVNDFHLQVLTPGVVIQGTPGAPAGWSVSSSGSQQVSWNGSALASGSTLGGFTVCFDSIPSSGVFLIRWRTTLDQQTVCRDSLVLQCAPAPSGCDSVAVADSTADCCYFLTVKNRHTPAGPLNDVHFTLLTPAYVLRPTPGAPPGWSVSAFTGSSVSFVSTSLLAPGANQPGFSLCFDPVTGVTGPIRVLWQTTLNGAVVCSDTLDFTCKGSDVRCDDVTASLGDSSACCWRFSVANLHQPPSPLNDFHIGVLTPGVTIVSATGPSGWSAANTASTADFATSASAIASGSTQGGFTVCFDPKAAQGKPFTITWTTTLDKVAVCSDTLTLQCALTGVEQLPGAAPDELLLHQNYPNPFNPATLIRFELPRDADVDLTVVDASGRTVVVLVHGAMARGRYQALFDASGLPSGQYFSRLRAGGAVRTRSMLLVK